MVGEALEWRPWNTNTGAEEGQGDGAEEGEGKEGAQGQREGWRGGNGLVSANGVLEFTAEGLGGLLRLVVPRPDLLVLGTGERTLRVGEGVLRAVREAGLRLVVSDTRNAAAQFNLLATERGTREVCAALLPVGFR